MQPNPQSKQQGVTLIEVLVTLVIVVIGLLGIVSLQIATMKNSTATNQRYQATLLAYDMAERMRTNHHNIADYDGLNANTDCSAGCSNVAKQDVYDWMQNLNLAAHALNNANGEISALGDSYLIAISWDEVMSNKAVERSNYTITVNI
ncbi:MAG: type IV pilus modification protein PilV [Pseudomonadales bacterium]|nr:type IV pilus modification protein PilV [Pseudomonadales bacterium]